MLSAEQDKTVFRYGASIVVGRDLTFSSWARLTFARSSFGPKLNVPDFVRRPVQADCEGFVYFMPATSTGDIDIAASFRDDDLQALLKDPLWNEHAEVLDEGLWTVVIDYCGQMRSASQGLQFYRIPLALASMQ